MNAFTRIAAALGAVVFTAAAVGLPDVCRYCTARALSAPQAHQVVARGSQPNDGHVGYPVRISLRAVLTRYRRLPI
ncbi:MAG TPA: hypothetical protein VHZ99_06880 [Steroidobacteraceae bacterium]|jgi:hypothetical protein|nr:hypothetical protein [Steroidobacteraceae bacterium]